MVPTDTHLIATNLFHHVHKLLLEHWVHRLDRDSSTLLGHGEYIDNSDSVIIMYLPDHESHDLEGNSRPRMLQHLQESKR